MGNVRILYSVILVVALLTLVPIASISADEITDTNAEGSFTTLPFAFIANEGQFVDGIAFQTTSPEQVISLRSDRIEYIHADGSAPVSVIFKGAEPNPVISGHDPMDGTAGFFYGSDPDTWTTGVELVTKVIYEGLYPGIDMQLSGSQGVLKTEFIVQPGADPSQIALQYEGQTEIYIDDEGALVASTGTRDIIDETPFSYQIVQDIETSVESAYLLSKDNVVTFELGSYDNTLPLVIDPVMRYSLYFGGGNKDLGNAIAVDDYGYAYMLGTAMSRSLKYKPEFSILSAQGNNAIDNSRDAFLVKINPDGTALEYLIYIGGSSEDEGNDLYLDTNGDIYICGATASRDFPTVNAFRNSLSGGRDAYITKINAAGTDFIFSTYIGGSANDEALGITLDQDRNILITGLTRSWDFPIVNRYELSPFGGMVDAFITKMNPTASAIIYSNFIGGSAYDVGRAIAVDAEGYAVVVGETESRDFPLVRPFQAERKGHWNAFVVAFDPEGTYPAAYSTYLGGSKDDYARDILAWPNGYVTVVGKTNSKDFPTENAIQPYLSGLWDGFITTFSPEGNSLVQSTYFGGSANEEINGIARDGEDNVYVIGTTNSKDLAIVNAYQSRLGGASDAFITKFDSAVGMIKYSTYLGGHGNDEGRAIAVTTEGDAYVTGYTESKNFPQVWPFQQHFGDGDEDAFVAVISDNAYIPLPEFVGVPTEGEAPLTVQFTDLSRGIPTAWHWNFGDGEVSAERDPQHVYSTPGIYTVSLTVSNIVSEQSLTKEDYIVVREPVIPPIADFAGVPQSGIIPLTVSFTDLTLNEPTSWYWDFGDGASSTEQNPIYTYIEPGIYTVSLTATNSAGSDTAIKFEFVTAVPPAITPIADFTGVPQSGAVPLSVVFTDLSLNEPTSWSWEFGDGGVSTEQHPTYTYTEPGIYTVSLTATNSAGSDTAIKTEFVFVSPAVIAPIADFSANPRFGDAPLTVKFADLSLNQPTSWSWEFGDGGVSTEQHPTYTYMEAGTYTVSLTVQNEAGIDTATKTEFVTASPAVIKPIADFIGIPQSGVAPLTVLFTDLSLNQPTSWSWEFGDGGVSTEQHPSYTYIAPGTYTVSLTVTNSAGTDTAIQKEFVFVSPAVLAPIADFSANPRSGVAPLTVKFADLSLNQPTSWSWKFGDGGVSAEQHPSYTYTAPGTYTVTLTVTNSAGTDTAIQKEFVFVSPAVLAPIADFSANPRLGVAPLTVKFADLSLNQPTSWSWEFGDGGVSTEQHPSYTYTAPGTYMVSLTVTNSAGIDTAMKPEFVTVSPSVIKPIADFKGVPQSGVAPLTVLFTDLSLNEPTSWLWNFGDDSTSTEQNPSYTYTAPGTYT
ncbi:MAG: PKD domain-containing protein, partial [Methanomicrobiales archaeon]|nr:PKD domain-containing protein [Methanomicrobiales archaeon]